MENKRKMAADSQGFKNDAKKESRIGNQGKRLQIPRVSRKAQMLAIKNVWQRKEMRIWKVSKQTQRKEKRNQTVL